MIYWIYNIPTWSLGVLIVSIFTILPTILLFPARRYIHKHFNIMEESNNVIGMFFSVASVFYGILMGLVVVSTMQNFSDASATISKEAAQIGALYRDISNYPEHYRSELQDSLREYTNFIIEVALPAHHQGVTPNANKVIHRFQDCLLSFNPATSGQEALHSESLRAFNDLIKARQMRILSVSTGLPKVFWIVVLIGTLFTIAITYFFHVNDVKLHVLLTAVTGFLIGLMIFLTAAFDNPFRGEVSVDAEPYRQLRDSIMVKPRPQENLGMPDKSN
jgi:lipid-A-disaccharide synthase-like uncharacterized protein